MTSESPCKSSHFIFYSSFPVTIVGGDGACQRKRVRPLLKSPRYDLFHDQVPLLVFAYCYGFCDLITLLGVTVYCSRGMHESRSDTSSSEINDGSRIFVLLIYLILRADSQSGEGATTGGSVPCLGAVKEKHSLTQISAEPRIVPPSIIGSCFSRASTGWQAGPWQEVW